MKDVQRDFINLSVAMDNFLCINGMTWFYDYRLNSICKLDFETAEVSIVKQLSSFGYDYTKLKIYGKIIK